MKQEEILNCSNESLKFKIDLMKAEADKLMYHEHIYKTALDMSDDAFIYEDLKTGKVVVSNSFYNMFDLQKGINFNQNVLINLICEEDKTILLRLISAKTEEFSGKAIEFRLSDNKTWITANVKFCIDCEGQISERIIFFRDITLVKKKNEELKYMAYFDSLTGLFNRNYFVKRLNDSLQAAKNERYSVTVLYMDIDDFKVINDSLGIVAGDEVIQMFAQDLNGLLDENMFAARIANDEFCIAVINPIGNRAIEVVYNRIKNLLRKTYRLINGREAGFSVSIGAAEYPESGETALEVMKNAEIALFDVKKNGKNNICYFDYQMYSAFLEALRLERQLNNAIYNKDFLLYFQPQFDVRTNRLRGVEALVRWKSDGVIISPDVFIPVSEKNGTIISIGDWVLEEAISTLSRWKTEMNYEGIMSINISTLQIKKEDFVRKLKAIIDKYYVNPEDVEIEITESVLIDDLEGVISKINTLRAYGIKVSLDDFGTGFSSLSYLKDLPIDTLKIDKTFVDGIACDASTAIITQSVISMVKQLGVETVAEGVENKEQYEVLKKMKCDNIQGFLMGRPMSGKDMERVILGA
ncbi:sensor domain-containing protein [Konateibacter massiliensis]|uniref:sensor domain-containing protein n=1 Tax=Konateibacter massiliensis TaxID=2002841 RepID=UPI00117A5F58|nr:bifunctional diguanylate cyclase/phosphodiesterase [Konateibacter massiliensis]